MLAQHLRLPPFGRELLSLRERGLVPAPHRWFGHVVVCLDAWDLAQNFTRVVVPTDCDPAALNFSFVAGLDVVMAYAPSKTLIARRDATIAQLLKFLPVSLRVVDMDAPNLGFWVKSRKHGLERVEYAP